MNPAPAFLRRTAPLLFCLLTIFGQSTCDNSIASDFDCSTDPASLGICVELHPETAKYIVDWACVDPSCKDPALSPEFDDGCSSLRYLQEQGVNQHHSCVAAWAELPRDEHLNLTLLGFEGGTPITVPEGELIPDTQLGWSVSVIGPSQLQLGQFFELQLFTNHRPPSGSVQVIVRFSGNSQAALIERKVEVAAASASGAWGTKLPGRIAYDPTLAGGPHIVDVALLDEVGRIAAMAQWLVMIVDDRPVSCPDQAQCGGMVCGREPVCGIPCGTCAPGQACTVAGQCEATHAQACPLAAECGNRVCGLDPVCGVPCGSGCDFGQLCTVDGRCEIEPSVGRGTSSSTGMGEATTATADTSSSEDDSTSDTSGSDCQDTCTELGTTECIEGQSRECNVDSFGCMTWSELEDCATGLCKDSTSCDECQHECELGETRCASSENFEQCTINAQGCRVFGELSQCVAGKICQNGRCTSPDCVDECPSELTTKCEGDKEIKCIVDRDADDCLEWEADGRDCPAGQSCQVDHCEDVCSDECELGQSTCAGDRISDCSMGTSGCLEWSEPEDCEAGHLCVDDTCQPSCTHECDLVGETSGDGELVKTCVLDTDDCRKWDEAVECADGGVCVGQACDDGSTIRAARVGAGISKTCAVTTRGALYCWGLNAYGALGNGESDGNYSTPQQVVGLESGVSDFAPAWWHGCAIHNGVTKCWGHKQFIGRELQKGEDPEGVELEPSAVTGLPDDVESIHTAVKATCALGASNWLKCWGSNNYGRLGNPDAEDFAQTPVDVDLDHGLTPHKLAEVSNSSSTFCAILSQKVHCWGNRGGALGDGLPAADSVALERPGGVVDMPEPAVRVIVGSKNACAEHMGKWYCWGRNETGAMGTGSLEPDYFSEATEMEFPLWPSFTAIALGESAMCAIAIDGDVYCWGSNFRGTLGRGWTSGVSSPTPDTVQNLDGVAVSIAMGVDHACAVLDDGRVRCWGANSSGQTGRTPGTSMKNILAPISVPIFGAPPDRAPVER